MSTLGSAFARIARDRRRNGSKLGRGTRGMPAPLTKRLSQDMRFHHEKVPRAGEEHRAAAEAGADTSGPFALSAHKQSYINETAARIKEKDRSFAGQLCAAALLGDASRIALIVQMMEDKRGVDWNRTLRLNPLQLACYSQQRGAVLALLSAGASTTFLIPGARLGWDTSALHTACQNADGWFAETLISAGANVYKAPAAAPTTAVVSGAAARSAARVALAAAARSGASRTAVDIALEYRQAGVLQVLAARNVIKNGWLQKQSRALNGLGKWKRRWFECVRMPGGRVLKLQYYKRPTGAPTRGLLRIVPRAARRVGSDLRGDFVVSCHESNGSTRKDVRLRAPSSEAANEWIEWLTRGNQIDGRATGGGWVASSAWESASGAEEGVAEVHYDEDGIPIVNATRIDDPRTSPVARSGGASGGGASGGGARVRFAVDECDAESDGAPSWSYPAEEVGGTDAGVGAQWEHAYDGGEAAYGEEEVAAHQAAIDAAGGWTILDDTTSGGIYCALCAVRTLRSACMLSTSYPAYSSHTLSRRLQHVQQRVDIRHATGVCRDRGVARCVAGDGGRAVAKPGDGGDFRCGLGWARRNRPRRHSSQRPRFRRTRLCWPRGKRVGPGQPGVGLSPGVGQHLHERRRARVLDQNEQRTKVVPRGSVLKGKS